tara:strand:- start:711 stop:1835 length:1125 start_codon:yes stop_codon:yes gene_type:complete
MKIEDDKSQFRIRLVEKYLEKIALSENIRRYYEGRVILITGGAGAIGSNLTLALSSLVTSKGKIVILDNLSAIKDQEPWNVPTLENVLFVQGDIRQETDLKRVFKEKPTIVFHLAAFFANQRSIDYPEDSALTDILGLIRLLEISSVAAIDKFIYASSGCAIYGSFPDLPVKEDFVSLHLTSPYQINKTTGEMYCNFFYHQYGLKTINCRFFNSYGPGEVSGQYRNVIPNFIYWSLRDRPLPITGTGEETRDFTYVLDLVQGLIKSAYYDEAVGNNFNLAAGKERPIYEVADLVNRLTGNKTPHVFKKQRKWDTKPRMWASINKAQELIDYQPKTDLETGIEENIKWFQLYWNEILNSSDFPPGMSAALTDKSD